MRRLLWLGIGLAVGALVVRKVTRTAQADTRTGGLEGRARSAAVRARRQQRWPHSSGIAACAKRRDRPDEVSGGRP